MSDTERSRVAHFSGVIYADRGVGSVQSLIVEETRRLWLSAGCEVRVYDLDSFTQVDQDETALVYEWLRTERSVILFAETELIGWDLRGARRWTFWLDPPPEVTVRGGYVYVKDEVLSGRPKPRLVKFKEDVGPDRLEPWDGVLA